jgi:hypothetical protein
LGGATHAFLGVSCLLLVVYILQKATSGAKTVSGKKRTSPDVPTAGDKGCRGKPRQRKASIYTYDREKMREAIGDVLFENVSYANAEIKHKQ